MKSNNWKVIQDSKQIKPRSISAVDRQLFKRRSGGRILHLMNHSWKEVRMKAQRFIDSFSKKWKQLPNCCNDTQWTEAMLKVLKGIGDEEHYYVQDKTTTFEKDGKMVPTKEFNNLDCVFWPDVWIDGDTFTYQRPIAVIEHENQRKPEDQATDFFKLCLYVADLRVFIGYGADPITNAEMLIEFYKTHDYRQIVGAETLIMLSCRKPYVNQMQWEVRLLQGQEGKWRRLPPIHPLEETC